MNTPDLPASVEITLPAMSFEIDSLMYDSNRKLQSSLQNFSPGTGSKPLQTQFNGVPYNLGFELNIYIRNIDDGLQIIEQILPFFTPDYTLSMSFIDTMNITRNVPIILDDVNMSTSYEGDASSEERRLVWTLKFTMQTYLFGPVSQSGLIKTATANTYYYSLGVNDLAGVVLTTANTPFGNFTIGETVYQGNNLQTANAIATVANWNYSSGQLALTINQGNFIANANVIGVDSFASATVLNVPSQLQLVNDVEVVNPITANIGDDFGFLSYITEFPNIK